MRKKLLNTKVTVKLRKSEYKEEWYLIVEAYPVYDPGNPKRKRIVESINRIIRTPIWDKSSFIGITPDGDYKYRPKRDANGVILCSSQLDQESCIYADEVRKLRQHEYDSAIIYTDKEAELKAQNERGEQDLVRLRNEPDNAKKVSRLMQKYPTFNEFVVANTPSRQFFLCQDPLQCFLDDSPCLRLLDIAYGMFASAIWLVPQIADVSVSCGLKEDASEVQIQLVAAAIASKYKYLRTDEVMLFLFNFKAGFYEQFYCYFDPQTIIRSMPTFLQERTNIIEEYDKELRRIEAEKNRLPGTPLEEINKKYFKTETLNKLLHLKY